MHPFPPSAPPWETQAAFLGLHLLLMMLVMGGCGGVLLQRKRQARSVDALAWCIAGAVLTVAFLCLAANFSESRNLRDGLLVVTWTAVFAGCWISWLRLSHQDDPKSIPISIAMVGVVGVVALAIAPLREHALEPSHLMQCKNNLHEIGFAFHDYHNATGTVPPWTEGSPPVSWRVNMLPYLGRGNLQSEYSFSAAWDGAANQPVARQSVPEYTCPSVPADFQHRAGLYFTSYALAVGDHTYWPAGGPLSFMDTPDGTANTVFVIEACGTQIVWTEPRDIDRTTTRIGVNLPGPVSGQSSGVFSSYHANGAHATFADGSVKFINADVDQDVLKSLLTIDGWEYSVVY